MQQSLKNATPWILLLLCAIPLFFLNIHNVHSWGGDDYALYIKEAQNIALGHPYYQSNYVFNQANICYSPPQYPPGFPLLLAPVVKMYGLAIRPMCYFISFLTAGLLFVLFAYFRKYASVVSAMCLAVLVVYGGYIIGLKQSIVSDIPCLLFTMLYLLFRSAKTFPWWRILLLVLFAAMAVLIRTQSVMIILAEGLYWLISLAKQYKRDRRLSIRQVITHPSLLVIIGWMALNIFISKVVFPTPASAAGFYITYLQSVLKKGIPSIVRDNMNFLLETVFAFFYYKTDHNTRTALVTFLESCGLVLSATGFIISVRRRTAFEELFFVMMCLLMLYYPIHDERYFLPAIALLYYYCYVALKTILPLITPYRWWMNIAFTIIVIITGYPYLESTLKEPQGYVPRTEEYSMFQYLQQHVNDTDIIVFTRPRFLTLYTNKRCMITAWLLPFEENKKVFDSMGIKYILVADGLDDVYYHTYLQQIQHPSDSVRINDGYTLYTMR